MDQILAVTHFLYVSEIQATAVELGKTYTWYTFRRALHIKSGTFETQKRLFYPFSTIGGAALF